MASHALPHEAMPMVCLALDAATVLRIGTASRCWRDLCEQNLVWGPLCTQLWSDKVHVPERFREAVKVDARAAYKDSLADSRRTSITQAELCSLTWYCRMKSWAGPAWMDSDPWWKGEACRERLFFADGRAVKRIEGQTVGAPGRWRFVRFTASSGRKARPLGSLLRILEAGREFPTHHLSRYPANWGWILQNPWGFSASFPLPPRGECPELEDDGPYAQAVTCETEAEETFLFNQGMPLQSGDEPPSDGELVRVQIGRREFQIPAARLPEIRALLAQAVNESDSDPDEAGEAADAAESLSEGDDEIEANEY